MKRYIIPTVILISIIGNILFGFLYAGQKSIAKGKDSDIHHLEKKLQQQKTVTNKSSTSQGLSDNETNNEVKELVKEFFQTQFNYNNKNFVERFEESSKFVTDDVLSDLKSTGDLEAPAISFENKLSDIDVYITSDESSVKGLIQTTSIYQLEGKEVSERNEMYQVQVEKIKGNWKITKLSLLGSFQPFQQS